MGTSCCLPSVLVLVLLVLLVLVLLVLVLLVLVLVGCERRPLWREGRSHPLPVCSWKPPFLKLSSGPLLFFKLKPQLPQLPSCSACTAAALTVAGMSTV
jgi:hypothetical protein